MRYRNKATIVAAALIDFLMLTMAAQLFAQNILPGELLLTQQDINIEDLYTDDEFVSIATGTNKSLRLAPSVTSVITAQDIKNAGVIEVEQVLEMVPGLHITRSPINRLNTVFSMRGVQTAFNPQVVLMLDGIELLDQFNGSRLNQLKIPVSAIKRIEVIRGPGSAVYGSDAFAGVINIITKSASDVNGTEVAALAGSFDTYGLSALHGAEYSGWALMANMEYQSTEGDSNRQLAFDGITQPYYPLPVSEAPGELQTHYELLQAQLKLQNEKGLTLDIKALQLLDSGVGQGAALILDTIGYTKRDYYQLSLKYGFDLSADFHVELHAYSTYLKEKNLFRLFPSGFVAPVNSAGNIVTGPTATRGPVTFSNGVFGSPGATQAVHNFSLASYYTGFENHLLRMQAGYARQNFKPFEKKNYGPGVLDVGTIGNIGGGISVDGHQTDVTGTQHIYTRNLSRDIIFLSFQDEWKLAADWELTSGIRYDKYPDFGETINPRLALVWAAAYNMTAKFLYGRAFRAPSNSEQFAINNPAIIGNDELEPEIIDTWEMALGYRPTLDSQFQLNLFSYQIKDLIEVDANRVYQNARDQEGYGSEIEYRQELTSQLNLFTGFAWQRSRDRQSNEITPLAPGYQFSMRLNWNLDGGWHISPSMHWLADRRRSRADPRPDLDDYARVDLALHNSSWLRNTEFSLSLSNVFDDNDVVEPSSALTSTMQAVNGDYVEEGRKLLLRVTYIID